MNLIHTLAEVPERCVHRIQILHQNLVPITPTLTKQVAAEIAANLLQHTNATMSRGSAKKISNKAPNLVS